MGINEPPDVVEARSAEHLVSHIDLNVPLPLCVRNAKELGPPHSTLGADNRILDVGHAPLAVQCVFSAFHDPAERFNAVVDVLCDRFALLLSEHQLLMNASTGGQLTSTERATLFGAEQGMEFSFRGFTVAAAWSRCSRRRRSEQTAKHG